VGKGRGTRPYPRVAFAWAGCYAPLPTRHPELGSQANEGDATVKKKNPHWGSSLDDFLKQEGIYDEVVAQVEKEVIATQLEQAMKKKK
jgi:hypothetical protein